MTDMTPDLDRLGDSLEQSAAADLNAAPAPRRRRFTTRAVVVVAALVIAVPGVAYAAHALTSDDVAASMPAGTLALAGTQPTCTVVVADTEFHCTLATPPAPEVSDWKGTVEPTVGKDKKVNGGCRSLASDGREWECYLGKAAVDQKIIGADFLGETSQGPGVG